MNSTPSEDNLEPGEAHDAAAAAAGTDPVSDPDPATASMEDRAGLEPEEPRVELDPVTLLQKEVTKWKDAALRSQADLENFRKRMARERTDAIKHGNADLLESLIPIIDNFCFGLDAARQESEDSVVFQGMSMVLKQMTDFLAEQGVTEIQAEGEVFDPNLHEAVQQEHHPEIAEGMVLTVVRRGYRLHGRVLRAAAVVVSKGPEPEGAGGDPPVTEASTTQP